jgi:hypothetical protein
MFVFIWSGWGLITPLFALLGYLVGAKFLDVMGPDQLPLCTAIGGMVAAVSCWIAGSFLPGRLWFIPIRYWGPIFLALSGVLAFDEASHPAEGTTSTAKQAAASPDAGTKNGVTAAAAAEGSTGQRTDSANSPVEAAPKEPPKPKPVPGMLSWEIRDETDKMTDEKQRKAFSTTRFDDGIYLEASASCDGIGIEFAFDAFRGREAAGYAWKDDNKMLMRLRIDAGDVRNTTVEAEYTNEAKILFYDPTGTTRTITGVLPHGQGTDNPVAGFFGTFIGGMALNQLEALAAGKLNDLPKARSIRVELPFADGSTDVVEINPQDQALRTIVNQCVADLRGAVEADRRAEQEAQKRAEQERVAKQNEQRRQAELENKRNLCVPGQEMVVLYPYGTTVRSVDEYNPRKAGSNVTVTNLPGETKVLIVSEAQIGLPPNAIPNDRCVVTYTGPQGRVVGTISINYLGRVDIYNAAKQAESRQIQCPPGTRPNPLGRCAPNGFGVFNR